MRFSVPRYQLGDSYEVLRRQARTRRVAIGVLISTAVLLAAFGLWVMAVVMCLPLAPQGLMLRKIVRRQSEISAS